MKLEDIKTAMLASEVRRWHIVSVNEQQTLADHHYRVAMLALYLYRSLPGDNEPEVERILLLTALVHDLSEVYTGDMPSPAKDSAPAEFIAMQNEQTPSIGGVHPASKTLVSDLVHLADAIEAYVWAYHHVIGAREEYVKAYTHRKVCLTLTDCVAMYRPGLVNATNDILRQVGVLSRVIAL